MSSATIVITGRLARDPELRTTHSGTSVCTLTIPVDTGWGDNKKTTWWKVSLWGKRAEAAGQHLRKKSWVTITGKPSVEEYSKRDGSIGFSPKVDASDFSFVGPKQQPDDEQPRNGGLSREQYNKFAASPDLPF